MRPSRPAAPGCRSHTTPPARRRGPSQGASAGEPAGRAPGRSGGGLTTKIHLAADSRCGPPASVLTPNHAGDAPAFERVMARLRVPRRVGRPGVTPDVVLADKAYAVERCSNKLRQWRGPAIRQDKTAATYLAGLHLAALFIRSAR